MEDYLENFGRVPEQAAAGDRQKSIITGYSLASEIRHGIIVCNLARRVALEMGLPRAVCYEIALAGMLHDIGKLKLKEYIDGQRQNSLMVEDLKYVRMHSSLGYELLKGQNYSEFVLKAVLHHHENFDGTGYPDNLSGKDIPLGARVIRVCDVYTALRSDRPYRSAFEQSTAMEMMIEEVKDFDMEVFLAFLRVMHSPDVNDIGNTSAFDLYEDNNCSNRPKHLLLRP